jgi:hypothetical protein
MINGIGNFPKLIIMVLLLSNGLLTSAIATDVCKLSFPWWLSAREKVTESWLKSTFNSSRLDRLTFEEWDHYFIQEFGDSHLQYFYNEIIKYAYCMKQIDQVEKDLFFAWREYQEDLERENRIGIQPPTMQIRLYRQKNRAIKIKRQAKPGYDQTLYQESVVDSFRFPFRVGGRKISFREKLYANYSLELIDKMAEVFQDLIDLQESQKVEITALLKNDKLRIIPVSAQDVYRFSLIVFFEDIKKTRNHPSYQGQNLHPLDFLTAAHELGVVTSQEIRVFVEDEKFFKPDISFFQKMKNYFKRIAGIAVEYHPATAPYFVIGSILYGAYLDIFYRKEEIEYENYYFR